MCVPAARQAFRCTDGSETGIGAGLEYQPVSVLTGGERGFAMDLQLFSCCCLLKPVVAPGTSLLTCCIADTGFVKSWMDHLRFPQMKINERRRLSKATRKIIHQFSKQPFITFRFCFEEASSTTNAPPGSCYG